MKAGSTDKNVLQLVTTASEGCELIEIEGKFVTNADEALKRINEIRLEACREGVWDPRNPSSKLTEEDYVPLQWSSELEYVARGRAAEASLVIGHTRPSGKSCFTLRTPGGLSSMGEVLAWNYSETMLYGIEQWYREKTYWVIQSSEAETGHYTQMIDPDNTYVGLGCFLSNCGPYYNTTSGEFRSGAGYDTKQGEGISDCSVITEMKQSFLSSPQLYLAESDLNSPFFIDKGDILQYEMVMRANLEDYTAFVTTAEALTWSSSDTAVATVDSSGKVVITGIGTVTITAMTGFGETASIQIVSSHVPGEWTVIEPATCTKNGKKELRCGICGELLNTGVIYGGCHTAGEWKTVEPATCTKNGKKEQRCISCGELLSTKEIAKSAHSLKNYTTPATTKADGVIVKKCKICGFIKSKAVIRKIKTVSLSTTSYIYDGKVKKPAVTVKNSSGKKADSSYYTVSYKNNKLVGTATVTIKLKGNYSGTVTRTFKILPQKVTNLKVTSASRGFTAKWKKVTSQVTGYQIRYSTSSKFSSAKYLWITKNTVTSKKVSKLSGKKRYYVQIRSYKTVNGTKYYSPWSGSVKVTTKK